MSKAGTQRRSLYDLAEEDQTLTEDQLNFLFKISKIQDETFHEIVQEVESHRLALGKTKSAFYCTMIGFTPGKPEKFMNSDIHKFYLSDIIWMLAKCGKKLKLEFVDLDLEE